MDLHDGFVELTGGVDFSSTGPINLADFDNGLTGDCNIGGTGRIATSVDDASASNNQIICSHWLTPNGQSLVSAASRVFVAA
jgi:hypothetical protein